MIRLNVFIQVNESNRNAALETAKELVAQSLNDNGCIAYDVFESATRKDVLMICETWKDAESLDAHEKAANLNSNSRVSPPEFNQTVPGFGLNNAKARINFIRQEM